MKKLLVIGTVWPEPKSSAAGTGVLRVVKLFQSLNSVITFVTTAKKTERSYNLNKLNIVCQEIELNKSIV